MLIRGQLGKDEFTIEINQFYISFSQEVTEGANWEVSVDHKVYLGRRCIVVKS